MIYDYFLPSYREALSYLDAISFPDSVPDAIAATRCQLSDGITSIVGVNKSGFLYLCLDSLIEDIPVYSISIGKLSVACVDLDLLDIDLAADCLPSRLAGTFLRVESSDLNVKLSVIDLVVDYLLSEQRQSFQAWLSDIASLFQANSYTDAIGLAGELVLMHYLLAFHPDYLSTWSLTPTSLFDFEPSSYSRPDLKHIEVKTTISPSRTVTIKPIQDLRQRAFSGSLLCNVELGLSISGLNCIGLSENLISTASGCLNQVDVESLRARVLSRLAFLGSSYHDIRVDLEASPFYLYTFSSLPALPAQLDPSIAIETYRLDLARQSVTDPRFL